MTTIIEFGPATPKDEICDFCSDPSVVTGYTCGDFEAEGIPGAHSVGGWVACAPCKTLIDSEQWEELAKRGAESIARKHPHLLSLGRAHLLEVTRRIHNQFRNSRTKVH